MLTLRIHGMQLSAKLKVGQTVEASLASVAMYLLAAGKAKTAGAQGVSGLPACLQLFPSVT